MRAKAAFFSRSGTSKKNLESAIRVESWEALGLGLAVATYLVIGVLLIQQAVPFGHDEAVYSARARDMVRSQPANPWWGIYRAPGLPFMLTLPLSGNGTETHLRLVVALSGAILVASTWLLGRLMVGKTPALVAAFGLGLTPVILTSATQVWPDIPAAAVGTAALALYAYGLGRERIPWWVVVAVPGLVGLATTIRYGAPIPLALGLAGLTLWLWPAGLEGRIRVAAVAAGTTGMVALIVMTPVMTGGTAPFAALAGLSAGIPFSRGFGDYWRLRSSLIRGPGFIALLGIASGLTFSFIDRATSRQFLWPLGIGIVTFVALSASVHGEARYLAPVYPWFWLAAGVGLVGLANALPRKVAFGSALAAVTVCGFLALELSDDRNRFNERFATLKVAAVSLDDGTPCGVFTSHTPQVEWYSECETVGINRDAVVTSSPLFPEGPRYLFIVVGGKRQPDADLLAEYIQQTTGVASKFAAHAGDAGDIEIWTFSDR